MPASGTVARCTSLTCPITPPTGGVALVRVVFGEVVGLPDPTEGVIFIVSGLVRSAVPHRLDVASPGELVRDAAGAVVGCRNLVVN